MRNDLFQEHGARSFVERVAKIKPLMFAQSEFALDAPTQGDVNRLPTNQSPAVGVEFTAIPGPLCEQNDVNRLTLRFFYALACRT